MGSGSGLLDAQHPIASSWLLSGGLEELAARRVDRARKVVATISFSVFAESRAELSDTQIA